MRSCIRCRARTTVDCDTPSDALFPFAGGTDARASRRLDSMLGNPVAAGAARSAAQTMNASRRGRCNVYANTDILHLPAAGVRVSPDRSTGPLRHTAHKSHALALDVGGAPCDASFRFSPGVACYPPQPA